MLKKTALVALTAVAITTGATAFKTPEANAGVNVRINLGGGGYYGGYYPYWGPSCFWKVKKYKVKVWTKWGPKWVWTKKKFHVCY